MSTPGVVPLWPVAVNTMSFMWRMPARETLEILAGAGYRRFELMAQNPHFDPSMPHSDARAFARFLRDAGLTVETLNVPSLDLNLASSTPDMREHSVKVYRRMIELAEIIGAQGIVVVTGRVNPLIAPPREQLETWFDSAFSRLVEGVHGRPVTLLLENIPMGVYPDAARLAAYASRVAQPAVRICYDIANAHFIGEDVAAGVRTVAPHLALVHLSDTTRAAWRHDPIGAGDCDFAAFAGALRQVGYAGSAMLEVVADPALQHIVASDQRFRALNHS